MQISFSLRRLLTQRKAASTDLLLVATTYLLVAAAALLPRVSSLGRFVTFDEVNFWMRRSELFLEALQRWDFPATAITDHPGVTTMWLGASGILLRQALEAWGIVADSSFATRLALMQLPVGIVTGLGVVAGYWLLRQLFDQPVALLAALLWALDPFMIAYSRVLHVDALTGTFTALSLLAACVYWHHSRSRPMLALSGACGGLAFVSKSPGLVLLPAIALIALLAAYQHSDAQPAIDSQQGKRAVRARLQSLAMPLLGWGAAAALAVVLAWPAVWSAPASAAWQIWIGFRYEGIRPHPQGNFFLGQPVAIPGPLFYPVALALRTTPLTLLGLLLLPLGLRRASPAARRDIAALAAFVIVFTILMSLLSKKFNRYFVPAFPTVDVLAAVGLLAAARGWREYVGSATASLRRQAIAIILVAALAGANVAFWHPYEIASFNQLLGGAQAGAYAFKGGWGEGLELTGEWLNQQPDITSVKAITMQSGPLNPYLRYGGYAEGAQEGQLPPQSGYVVIYISNAQGDIVDPPSDQFYGRVEPTHVVTIHGVPYAWIYQVPPTIGHPLTAKFGSAIELRGFDIIAGHSGSSETLTLQLYWMARESPAADYTVFTHLLGNQGEHLAQVDIPLPTSRWLPNRYYTTSVPLALDARARNNPTDLVIGLYSPASGQRLPLMEAEPLDPAIDGPEVLRLPDT